jgi:prephenate dehydratase
MTTIGFLGPKGTFSHDAIKRYLNDKKIKKKNYKPIDISTIPELISLVMQGELDEAIVPIENSLEGAVNVTLDMMALDVSLLMKDELVIDIEQNLLVNMNTQLKDIDMVISHPQPIGQCRRFLNENCPKATIKYVYSTAEAAEEVRMSQKCNMAAIGSISAAEVYCLDVLASSIQDGDNNRTRFVVLGKCDSERTGKDKTSIVFSLEDKPGSLHKILNIFDLWDINMTRIESRPAKNKLGRYIFFIDFIGHRDDDDIKDALTMIRRKTSFYKFLGSYPEYM